MVMVDQVLTKYSFKQYTDVTIRSTSNYIYFKCKTVTWPKLNLHFFYPL